MRHSLKILFGTQQLAVTILRIGTTNSKVCSRRWDTRHKASCLPFAQFKDRQREKQRKSALRAKEASATAAAATAAEKGARSGTTASKAHAAGGVEPLKKMTAAKRRLRDHRQDADDLADDYALLKRLKKGKMTEVWLTLGSFHRSCS